MGLAREDEIAVLGDPFDVYYAFLDHLRVVATIGFQSGETENEAAMFWAMDSKSRKALEDRLTGLGIVAIVASSRCPSIADAGWQSMGDHHYCVLRIGHAAP